MCLQSLCRWVDLCAEINIVFLPLNLHRGTNPITMPSDPIKIISLVQRATMDTHRDRVHSHLCVGCMSMNTCHRSTVGHLIYFPGHGNWECHALVIRSFDRTFDQLFSLHMLSVSYLLQVKECLTATKMFQSTGEYLWNYEEDLYTQSYWTTPDWTLYLILVIIKNC